MGEAEQDGAGEELVRLWSPLEVSFSLISRSTYEGHSGASCWEPVPTSHGSRAPR